MQMVAIKIVLYIIILAEEPDSHNDGVSDNEDDCSNTPNGTAVYNIRLSSFS